ncbi:methyltransferase domain-containing protein [Bacillus safensis]|uniref:class I SAM-dependent methyltransferase n=1 Tax=Bacillus safensis TaxID=561879 RepID=UPI002151198A|nr:class I SAM-dependent methyltransferase [Bacillus safensis]MCR6473757.1 methyltransferase domain-containing protein [Bacillus safensis]MEE3679325.1 methyltransferase domain-containing protein [Bacillus safensis]WHX75978.1 methyltransferase domain-containing protein [Bacillus safensis]WHX83437.1 methyltransferase domain-containing protein [Bacillus safensis]
MLKSESLNNMNYNELIAIIGETNRPPGGIRTVMDFVLNTNITNNTKILEIGTSTGFTAIELAKRTDASITAIDINESSISIATKRAIEQGVASKIDFIKADATNLPFLNEEFDYIFSGNIISYIPNRKKALSEYIRVLKKNGVLFATPMYYLEEPSKHLIEDVREALKMNINIDYRDYWMDFFNINDLDLFLVEEFQFNYVPDKDIKEYVKNILLTNKNYLEQSIDDEEVMNEFSHLYEKYIYLFRDNLSKMGYSELFLRKNKYGFDQELFTAHRRKTN